MHKWNVWLLLLATFSGLLFNAEFKHDNLTLAVADSSLNFPAFPSTANLTTEPTIHLEPATHTVAPGQVFSLTVSIDAANNLGGFEFGLHYNTSGHKVDLVQVQPGNIFSETGRLVFWLGPALYPITSTVTFGAASGSLNNALPGANNHGSLAVLSFMAADAGATDLNFEYATICDIYANCIPVQATSAHVNIVNPATTTPTSTMTPSPSPSPTASPTATPSATSTASASYTPTLTPASTSSATPITTHTPTPTSSPTPSTTPTATPTPTSIPRFRLFYFPFILQQQIADLPNHRLSAIIKPTNGA